MTEAPTIELYAGDTLIQSREVTAIEGEEVEVVFDLDG